MAAPSSNTLRLYVLTGSVAAITATGAWYGAGLKTRQEFKQERNTVFEATLAERIDQMETAKARLLRQRDELQSKIATLHARQASSDQPHAASNRWAGA